ncbi:MAG TPA: long-chain fatty acid--CoA ligase [Candidatus Limnocylindria bacterium]
MGRRLNVTGEPIRLAEDERARNLLDLARRSVTGYDAKVAYTWKPSRRAARAEGREPGWQSVTFGELWSWVERVAAGLAAWGVGPGDRVAIMSRSRPEWLVCDLAAMSLGAVTCPIYHAERDLVIGFILGNTQARFAIVESANLARRLAGLHGTALQGIVVLDPADDVPEATVTLEGLMGQAQPDDAWRGAWQQRWSAFSRADLATIIHTSGATADPKGVPLTHGNVLAHCEMAMQAMPFSSDDLGMSVLPLSHIAERAGGQMVPLAVGASITFAEPVIERWPANLREVRPTVMVSVPPIFARIYRRIQDQLDAGPAWKRRAFAWATGVGSVHYANHLAGRADGPWISLQLAVARRFVFRPIKELLGGRLRFFACGGAPLPQAIGELFYSMDILILEAWGLTEASGVLCMNRPDSFRFGTVGLPFPGTEIRIDPETSEILARGPQVFGGYLNLPEENATAFEPDGWFHTGDIGEIDEQGRVKITDRLKNLIVLANGKKVMPAPMENALAASPYIGQSVILGDHHERTGALVTLDLEHVRSWAAKNGIGDDSMAEIAEHPAVRELIESEVRRLLAEFAPYERPRRVSILPRELTEEADELTAIRKPKRRVIVANFPDHVARLFEGERVEVAS